jgi:predicted site-specific integrase-resolvase
MSDALPQLMKPAELAKILDCSEAALRERVREGKIPGVVQLSERGTRFKRDVIERWIAQSTRTDLSETGEVVLVTAPTE